MPFGATALDFAYDIHSKIGNSAISAKINHKARTDHHADQQRRPDRDHNGRYGPSETRMAGHRHDGEGEIGHQELPQTRTAEQYRAGHATARGEDEIAQYPAQRQGIAQDRPGSTRATTKRSLYSKIGAGIVSLDDLDKVLKVNSKSKILKFWTLFIPQKKRGGGRRHGRDRAAGTAERAGRRTAVRDRGVLQTDSRRQGRGVSQSGDGKNHRPQGHVRRS